MRLAITVLLFVSTAFSQDLEVRNVTRSKEKLRVVTVTNDTINWATSAAAYYIALTKNSSITFINEGTESSAWPSIEVWVRNDSNWTVKWPDSVHFSDSSRIASQSIGTSSAPATDKYVFTRITSTTYGYKDKANFRDQVVLVPDITPPDAITNLVADSVTATSVRLRWTVPAGTPASYDIRSSLIPIGERDVTGSAGSSPVFTDGTAVLPANSDSVTVAVSTTKTKAYLRFSLAPTDNVPRGSQILGYIKNDTTLVFRREEAGVAVNQYTIYYRLCYHPSAVTVQHGQVTMNDMDTNITISAVTLANTFVLPGAYEGVGTWDGGSFARYRFTSTTNLQITTSGTSSATVGYQVVSMDSATVAHYDVTQLGTSDASKYTAITSVDTAKSFIINTWKSDNGTSTLIGEKLLSSTFHKPDSVLTSRGATGSTVDATIQVVTIRDGSVQHKRFTFAGGDLQEDATITSVTPSRTFTYLAGYHGYGGTAATHTVAYTGLSWYQVELTAADNIRLTRGRSNVAATAHAQIVSFPAAGSSTADTASWESCTLLDNEPTPVTTEVVQSFVVSGLSPSTVYYFAMKSSDAAGNESGISNVVTATTSALVTNIARIWAVDDGENIKQDDIGNPLATSDSNYTWDNDTIKTFSAKNEMLGFQLIIEAQDTLDSVYITLDSLHKSTATTYTIKNTGDTLNAFDYNDIKIEMFVMSYMNVPVGSSYQDGGWGAGWPEAKPGWPSDTAKYLGWLPEWCVPKQSPSGSRTNGQGGFPFSVAANKNQAVWIDVFIPRDAVAGDYYGTVKVYESGVLIKSIPMYHKVYDFILSDTSHLKAPFFISTEIFEKNHGIANNTASFWAMYRKYAHMFKRHRALLTEGRRSLTTLGASSAASFDVNLGNYYVNGANSYYTRGYNYEGPGDSLGQDMYLIGMYDQPVKAADMLTSPRNGGTSGFWPATQAQWRTASDAWETWFETNANHVRRAKYMGDEIPRPGETEYAAVLADVKAKCMWVTRNPGTGNSLHTFLSARYLDPALRDSISIWSPGGRLTPFWGADHATMSALRGRAMPGSGSRTTTVGTYNFGRPYLMNGMLQDSPGTDYITLGWTAFKDTIDHYLSWRVDYWAYRSYNPWSTLRSGLGYNGDGSFVVTGEDMVNTGNSRGLAGPIASRRLKQFRRGQQDYEALWYARSIGKTTSTYYNVVSPASFNKFNGTTYISTRQQPVYLQNGYKIITQRRKLYDAIVAP